MSEETLTTDITKEKLIAAGWSEPTDAEGIMKNIFPLEKKIPNRNPLNSDDTETGITLSLNYLTNDLRFAIVLPDGGMIYFVANSMADLEKFESMLDYFDPNF